MQESSGDQETEQGGGTAAGGRTVESSLVPGGKLGLLQPMDRTQHNTSVDNPKIQMYRVSQKKVGSQKVCILL